MSSTIITAAVLKLTNFYRAGRSVTFDICESDDGAYIHMRINDGADEIAIQITDTAALDLAEAICKATRLNNPRGVKS